MELQTDGGGVCWLFLTLRRKEKLQLVRLVREAGLLNFGFVLINSSTILQYVFFLEGCFSFLGEMLAKDQCFAQFNDENTRLPYTTTIIKSSCYAFGKLLIGSCFAPLIYAFDKALMAAFSYACELCCTGTFQVITAQVTL